MKTTMLKIAVAAALAVPVAAQATLYTFNATLSGSNERPTPVVTSAHGLAIVQYDDSGTVGNLLDDSFSVAVAGFNLSGPPTGYHIHAAATTDETAPVRVNFENPPFTENVFGNNIIIGGTTSVTNAELAPGIVDGMIPATASTGQPAMSFLQALQSHLAYVNIHTALNPSGEIRGQLLQVTAIPEPETYALMIAGLGLVGWVASRRRKVGV
jgi:hypothetical protein